MLSQALCELKLMITQSNLLKFFYLIIRGNIYNKPVTM